MSNKDTIWIVAGNRQEFDAYVLRKINQKIQLLSPVQLRSSILTEYKFVFRTDQLRGLDDIKGFYIGSYKSRPDIDEIHDAIAMIKSKSILRGTNTFIVHQEGLAYGTSPFLIQSYT